MPFIKVYNGGEGGLTDANSINLFLQFLYHAIWSSTGHGGRLGVANYTETNYGSGTTVATKRLLIWNTQSGTSGNTAVEQSPGWDSDNVVDIVGGVAGGAWPDFTGGTNGATTGATNLRFQYSVDGNIDVKYEFSNTLSKWSDNFNKDVATSPAETAYTQTDGLYATGSSSPSKDPFFRTIALVPDDKRKHEKLINLNYI